MIKTLLFLLAGWPLYAVTCPSGVTHIAGILRTGDGVTPAAGKILVKGPSSPSGSVVSTTITITIGAAGAYDFCLIGGVATHYSATYLLTDPVTGRATNSYSESWIVPATIAQITIDQLWGGSAAPQYLVNQQQINPAGLGPGQLWVWSGTAFVPGTAGVMLWSQMTAVTWSQLRQ